MFKAGANPAEPRFWDLCLFTPADIAQQNIGYNASRDGARIDHVLHKIGSLLQCDPVHPRAQGISLTRHGLGRGGTSGAAARIEFVKSNDTAALMSENGAVASMVPNALHIARAWVRCVKGSATVALVVSSLPERARQENTQFEPTLKHYDSLSNVSIGAGGPNNVLHCKLAPSTYASDRDASETQSQWTELAVGVMSSKPEHEVSVQLVVQSHSDDAAILADDVSFETKTSSVARASTPSDGSTASVVFSTQCSGGGGAEVSFSDSHRCSSDPTYLFYRIREKGGVPVAYEQVHAMVTLGYKAIKCRKPDIMDDVTKAQCPHLSQATLPHLSAMDVKRWGRRGHNNIYPLFHIHFLIFSMLNLVPAHIPWGARDQFSSSELEAHGDGFGILTDTRVRFETRTSRQGISILFRTASLHLTWVGVMQMLGVQVLMARPESLWGYFERGCLKQSRRGLSAYWMDQNITCR